MRDLTRFMTLTGTVIPGCQHFTGRMTKYRDVFKQVTGETFYPGTINVDVGQSVPIQEEFRIKGTDIGEPDQDLLFERCRINGHPAHRIRPYHLLTGQGGHGDDILEIASSEFIPNADHGKKVEIEFPKVRRVFDLPR